MRRESTTLDATAAESPSFDVSAAAPSVTTALDVVVHVHAFRNVDLLSRGLYAIRARVRRGDRAAKPYAFSSDPILGPRTGSPSAVRAGALGAPTAAIDGDHFTSRACSIAYQDEVVDYGEGAQFRLDLPAAVVDGAFAPPTDAIDVELELLYAADAPGSADLLAPVARRTLRVRGDETSAHAFLRRADLPLTNRGGAAATTWRVRRR